VHLTEVAYQHPATQTYLGSPSLIRLPNGDLLAKHDYYGPDCPRNHEGEEFLTSLYRSRDDGRTWANVTHIAGSYWSSLFLHRGALYLLGTSQQYGSIVISRSQDSGNTWTLPHDAHNGLLFQGGPYREPPNYHTAPMPVLCANGRLYRAFEDCDPCVWPTGFRALTLSVDVQADLLEAANWRMSNKLAFDPAWLPPGWGRLDRPGWLEGNMVQSPDGALWDILRFNSRPLVDKAAMVQVSAEGAVVRFDPATGFIDLPGGMSKFSIRQDAATGWYLTLSNTNTEPDSPTQRNVLSLHASRDLRHWVPVTDLLRDDSPLSHEDSLRLTGFQYVDWQFDNDDLIYLVRTAYQGAHNYHDANRITFHRLERFRSLLMPLIGVR
jgi:hypothetical protein